MDLGLSGGGGRKRPVTKAQLRKQQANYARADQLRLAKERHHLREETQAEQDIDQELRSIDGSDATG